MKPLVKSRLVWILAAVVAAQLGLYLRRYLPAEQAALLSDELVATLCAALGISGIGLRAADKRRARTAGAIVDAKAAKAAAKLGAGLALALLCGCDRSAEADAAFATEGRCGETVIRTMRKGVPVQCTIYGCRFPTRMSTLFCDEVP